MIKNISKFNVWIAAFRPRTIFLAMAGALMGNGLVFHYASFSLSICIFTILTAVSLQLLSNLANDLGDYQHGTDTTGERTGPTRAVQSGMITPAEMKKAVILTALVSLFSGAFLISQAAKYLTVLQIVLFLLLGILAVLAAIKYTVGKNPYGYIGWGDFFSFLFFGPVAVVGTFFLQTHYFDFYPVFPSLAIGFLTASVLNINNMRDIENDNKSGKITIPVRIGLKKAKLYHLFLILAAFVFLILFSVYACKTAWYQFLYLIAFVPFFFIMKNIMQTKDNRLLDPFLKQTSITTFILTLLFIVCIAIFP